MIVQHVSQLDLSRTDLLIRLPLDMDRSSKRLRTAHMRSTGGPLEVGNAGVGDCIIAGGRCSVS